MSDYDETQAIGRRYRRQDELGTPLCVTVDFDTLDDHAVTVRDRDSMDQERVPSTSWPTWSQPLAAGPRLTWVTLAAGAGTPRPHRPASPHVYAFDHKHRRPRWR